MAFVVGIINDYCVEAPRGLDTLLTLIEGVTRNATGIKGIAFSFLKVGVG